MEGTVHFDGKNNNGMQVQMWAGVHLQISSTADSRVVYAAIENGRHLFLEKCRNDVGRIHSLSVRKSLAENINPLLYAMRKHDLKAMKIICKKDMVSRMARVEKPRLA